MARRQRVAFVDEKLHLSLASVEGVWSSTQYLLLLLGWLQDLGQNVLLALQSGSWQLDVQERRMQGVKDANRVAELPKIEDMEGQSSSSHYLVAAQGLQHRWGHLESQMLNTCRKISAELGFCENDGADLRVGLRNLLDQLLMAFLRFCLLSAVCLLKAHERLLGEHDDVVFLELA